MGVSKNRGILPPKWLVKLMVPNPMNKWMIWGSLYNPYFWVDTHINSGTFQHRVNGYTPSSPSFGGMKPKFLPQPLNHFTNKKIGASKCFQIPKLSKIYSYKSLESLSWAVEHIFPDISANCWCFFSFKPITCHVFLGAPNRITHTCQEVFCAHDVKAFHLKSKLRHGTRKALRKNGDQ